MSEASYDAYQIDIADQQSAVALEHEQIRRVVRLILQDAEYAEAYISIALVDDPTIHEVNRRFLNHDYPTDVISFPLDATTERLEGEIIASGDTARAQSLEHGASPEDELLLYVVHGTLHLVGYDDHDEDDRRQMRQREAHYLAAMGKVVAIEDSVSDQVP